MVDPGPTPMHVLVDLQHVQLDTGARGAAQGVIEACAGGGPCEQWSVLLNEALPGVAGIRQWLADTFPGLNIRLHTFPCVAERGGAAPANEWAQRVSELLREHVIGESGADVVVLPDASIGFGDGAVCSVGRLERNPWTILGIGELAGLGPERDGPVWNRRLQDLKNADRVLVRDAGAAAEWAAELAIDPERIVTGVSEGLPGVREADAAVRPGGRPRLAYVSPLPPQRSGIADYSAELIPELARYYEVELVTEYPEVDAARLTANFPIRSPQWFDTNAHRFDRIVYQMGNSHFHAGMVELLARHPGTVVLHDFYLGHMYAARGELGAPLVYRTHGYTGLLRLREGGEQDALWSLPFNREVVDTAAGVVVHSAHARDLGTQWLDPEVARRWAVIPHLRRVPADEDRRAARQRLGIDEDVLLVCSFGNLGATKLNHRLLQAWRSGGLAREGARLAFVGGVSHSDYTNRVLDEVKAAGAAQSISVTGYLDAEQYGDWLAAADVAVQLRTSSRGESSGAVLDCLARGLATVVNDHGSAAEFPDDVVCKLPADFTDTQLADALRGLLENAGERREFGERGRAFLRAHCHPERIGRLYRDAVEAFHARAPVLRERRLVAAIQRLTGGAPDEAALRGAAQSLAALVRPAQRQLLVDASAIRRHDLGTGIQRVVRAQIRALVEDPPTGYRIEPVFLADSGDHYRYAHPYTCDLLGLPRAGAGERPVEVRPGDLFLAADFDREGALQACHNGILERWRRRGVGIYFSVYDILPATHPRWFPRDNDRAHARWLQAVARVADGLIAISETVARETRDWLAAHGLKREDDLHLGYARLGAELDGGNTGDAGATTLDDRLLQRLRDGITITMVGTIEPRKGHLQTLEAFERLWTDGEAVNLVIVGGEGWMGLPDSERRNIPETVQRLRGHPQNGERLHWLAGISDADLEAVYAASDALLAASEGEGFGLPLVEAANHGLPIIARDIPVFREVAGDDNAWFFNAADGDAMAGSLRAWLARYRAGTHPVSDGVERLRWSDNVERIKGLLTGALDWPLRIAPAGAETVAVVGSAGDGGLSAAERHELQDLRYLEEGIDGESGDDKGPLAGKEVLVYAPEKSGSVSLYHSIGRYLATHGGGADYHKRVLHNHHNQALAGVLRLPAGMDPDRLARERTIVRDLVRYNHLLGRELTVVSSMREPLSRVISGVFQHLEDQVTRRGTLKAEEVTYEHCRAVLEHMMEHFLRRPHPLLEIDPAFFERHRFDKERKRCCVTEDGLRILVVTLEGAEYWQDALEQCLGYSGIEVTTHNTTGGKPLIAEHYEAFKSRLRLDEKVIRRIYYGDDPPAQELRWFYTEPEIEAFYERALARYGRKESRRAPA
ncbi:glycosyltransferase [Arhodomonas sp. SL1]|uniref:glycosyltransferase n=1 Tax=Arhodomonas sp. SL1 TaxID=3425691 RepID=UPI003F8814CF